MEHVMTQAALAELVAEQTDRIALVLDAQRRIVFANAALRVQLGYTPEEARGRLPSELLGSPHYEGIEQWRRQAWGSAAFEEEFLAADRAGRDIWFRAFVNPVADGDDDEPHHLVVVLSDVTRERQLRDLQHEVLRALTSMPFQEVGDFLCRRVEALVPEAVASTTLVDAGRLQLWAAPSLPAAYAVALNGVKVGEGVASCGTAAFRGEPIVAFDIATDPRWDGYRDRVLPYGLRSCWSFPVLIGGEVAGTFALYFREPTLLQLDLERMARACADLCALGIERERHRSELAQLARYDPLTGLANRRQLRSGVEEMIERSREEGEEREASMVIFCLGLDRFADVNTRVGHAAGDRVLVDIGNRLQEVAGRRGLVGRLEGDRFGVAVPGVDRARVPQLAARLCAAVARPIEVAGERLLVSASVGVGTYPANGGDAETILGSAERAMLEARAEGGGTYRFVTAEMNDTAQDRILLGAALRDALEREDGLRLAYQPQVVLGSGAVHGVEALMRWRHPDLGEVSPGRFIPVAEEIAIIDQLGRWTIREACRQIAEWRAAGVDMPSVSVNLAATSLAHSDLVELVAETLTSYGVEPASLVIEITESMLLALTDDVLHNVQALRDLGVGFSIDDFGTGFSSLATLASIPLTEVKIDRSFIVRAEAEPRVRSLVRAMLGIGASLGLTVVAEGVETPEQLTVLDDHTVIQGFLYSRPLAPDELARWLADRR